MMKLSATLFIVVLLVSACAPATPITTPPPGITPSPTPPQPVSPTPAFSPTWTSTASVAPSLTSTPAATLAPTDTPTRAASLTPTGNSTALPGSETPPASVASSIKHVFVVIMENHDYNEIWGSSSAPYINSLGAQYARTTNYHAQIHPSLPNYLQLFAGSNYSITTDCLPSSSCHASGPNIGDRLDARGLSWKAYLDAMPAPCSMAQAGTYAPRHNPLIYFDDIRNDPRRCAAHDVPYSALPVDLLKAATTPNLALIIPDLCHDMHDCTVTRGDDWLQANLPPILASPACTTEACLLVLLWDEDDHHQGNQVLTIFAGSAAQSGGKASGMAYTHYSLLRTIEDIFGLPTLTANDAAAIPMLDLLKQPPLE